MAYASSLPYAIAALVSMLAAEPGLTDAVVNDGEGLTDSEWDAVVCIGMPPESEDDTVAEATVDVAGLGPDSESYDVHCGIAVLLGDEDAWADTRARACGYLETIGQVLAVSPTLRGVVSRARIASWSLRMDETEGGTYAKLRFDVHVDAFTRR